jgi:putative endonuclease
MENKGFSILERNYTRKWGEIDIVSKNGSVVHFVEVKSKVGKFSKEADRLDLYRPEDNMHPWKLKRLSRTVRTYLAEHSEVGDWQFDLIVIYLDIELKNAHVKFFENLVL